ncbi:MAG TPA: hypothetical protein VGH27_24445 [Streptosporangiaceae bacterium]|jgi:hypothetical protein
MIVKSLVEMRKKVETGQDCGEEYRIGSPLPGYASPMAAQSKARSPQAHAWVEARKRYRLSHVQVQMARELGLNPRKLGKIANHGQEPWKSPLPQFIEHLYLKRFGRERPQVVVTPAEKWGSGRPQRKKST